MLVRRSIGMEYSGIEYSAGYQYKIRVAAGRPGFSDVQGRLLDGLPFNEFDLHSISDPTRSKRA